MTSVCSNRVFKQHNPLLIESQFTICLPKHWTVHMQLAAILRSSKLEHKTSFTNSKLILQC